MKSSDWDDSLLQEHRKWLKSASAVAAFDVLVAVAADLDDYECKPAWHGAIRDFRYVDVATKQYAFAFIVNRSDLLFYVRKPALSRVTGGTGMLAENFPAIEENSAGEWTIRIANALQAARLADLVFAQRSEARDHSSALISSVDFAAKKHRDQRRKDKDASPYINHPIALAALLSAVGVTDKAVLTAALLHDTVEDTQTTFAELQELFGEKVAGIVREVTDDKSLAKEERKELQVLHAATLTREAKLVKLADKICNLKDVSQSPPADWTLQRKREYFDWAKRVIDGLRGVHPVLEQLFDDRYSKRP